MNNIKHLNDNGFLVLDESHAIDLSGIREQIIAFRNAKKINPIYGKLSFRDLHLCNLPILQLILQERIISVLKSVLGDNLLVWRSQVFYKDANAPEIGWHQEWGAFKGEERGGDKASLKYNDSDNFFRSLTVWIPLQDVTIANGALQMIPGSHKSEVAYELVDFKNSAFNQSTTDELIYKKNGKGASIPEERIANRDKVTLEVKAGNPIIFSERTLHRSLPNKTKIPRVAINYRVITSDTLVYPSRLKGDFLDGVHTDISNHQSILISGLVLNQNNKVLDCTSIVK